jgi:hypothetical protein
MPFLSEAGKARYGPVFEALGSNLPASIAMIKKYGAISLSVDFAEYAMVRTDYTGKGKIHYFYFTQEDDGVWRLDSM